MRALGEASAAWIVALACAALPGVAAAATLVVAPSGGDFTSIQAALDAAAAGDTILVREKPTPYFEKLVFPRSGSAAAGFVSLEAWPGERPALDGTGVQGADMVLIESRSWVRISGFEIRNDLGVNDGSGVRVVGSGSHIEIRDNDIHDIRGRHAMGITVYGTEPMPISDLVIDGNQIHDCEPYRSEALALNGNVDGFAVTNNVVRDVNNIGIVFIGGETDINPDPTKAARNGVCRGNRVMRAREKGGGWAAGIYVDGGRDIVIESNLVTESDIGIEIGAENPGQVASGVVVRDNLIYANDKAGLAFGGYAAQVGRTRSCELRNNTIFRNDPDGIGFGELWIQWADGNTVRNNLIYGTAANRLLTSEAGNTANDLDYNLWFTPAGPAAARFLWNGTEHAGFAAYRAATGQDANSQHADPLLVAPQGGDFHLGASSPAIDAGDPATVSAPGEVDLDGAPRASGLRVDVGADEVTCGDGALDPGEACDDGNTLSGDGCDANCTVTACGNRVVTAGEQCDDGNSTAGDCCDAACQHEAAGSACDDGDLCTRADSCLAGACLGLAEPAPLCRAPGRSTLVLRDRTPDSGDSLTWRWLQGEATTFADLGDPIGGATGYALCLFDSSAGTWSLALRSAIPAGGSCAGRACWSALGNEGVRYSSPEALPDGVVTARLRSGEAGRSSVVVTARGASLPLPVLPLAHSPSVAVELRSSDGSCWGATFATPPTRNQAGLYRARTP